MSRLKTLPIGIDIGMSRVRMSLAEMSRDGEMRLHAAVSRDVPGGAASSNEIAEPELVAGVLDELLHELQTRERRCVLSIGVPSAALRVIRFPRMRTRDRSRAARFEAQRFAPWNVAEEASVVRVHAVGKDDGRYAVGVVKADVLQSRLAAVHKAHLRIVAIDHDACALRRALPFCDAIVDIGMERSTVHAFGENGPHSWVLEGGGSAVSAGIARDLTIDVGAAERRKRILGAAGAGGEARDGLVMQIASAIERARSRTSIARIALTGNGARLPGLATELENATAAIVDLPVSDLLRGSDYPDDVVRAAAPDWTLAAGLAHWWRA